MREANQQQQFNRNVEDIELWLYEVEGHLASDDYGKDLTSVQNLQKKQALLEADVAAHQVQTTKIHISDGQIIISQNSSVFPQIPLFHSLVVQMTSYSWVWPIHISLFTITDREEVQMLLEHSSAELLARIHNILMLYLAVKSSGSYWLLSCITFTVKVGSVLSTVVQ